MQVATTIEVRPKFLLQSRDYLAKRLLLFGHYVGEQKRIKNSVALRQVTGIADAARLLATDYDLTIHHQISNVFESDRALVKFAPMFGGDAVQHARCIEGSNNFSRPLLAAKQPIEQDSEYFV